MHISDIIDLQYNNSISYIVGGVILPNGVPYMYMQYSARIKLSSTAGTFFIDYQKSKSKK